MLLTAIQIFRVIDINPVTAVVVASRQLVGQGEFKLFSAACHTKVSATQTHEAFDPSNLNGTG
jgi:hypothetical protein